VVFCRCRKAKERKQDFAAAGLRLGCLITQNALLRKAMASNSRFHSPSGPSVAIGTAILQDHSFVDHFIKLSRERLSDARKYTIQCLQKAGIEHEGKGYVQFFTIHSKQISILRLTRKLRNAGLFLFIDLRPWLRHSEKKGPNESENELAQRLLDAGVGVHPCEEHFEKPGYFRLVFSQEKHILEEGLRRYST
jgi:1-aminocyclopropane-1-carboxylate synthase